MNKFAFIVPMRNAHATLAKCLASVAVQSYPEARVVLIDDASEPASVAESQRIVSQAKSDLRIEAVWRSDRRWETANVLEGLSRLADDEIACRLDADDWLCDTDALRIVDEVYSSTNADALWTAHRWGYTAANLSAPLPAGADPYSHPWVSSHLKTWRAGLSHGVADANYRNADGEYVKRAGDQAIYLPVLMRSRVRVFVPIVAYHYTCSLEPATFQTDDAKFQRAEAEFIRKRGYVS